MVRSYSEEDQRGGHPHFHYYNDVDIEKTNILMRSLQRQGCDVSIDDQIYWGYGRQDMSSIDWGHTFRSHPQGLVVKGLSESAMKTLTVPTSLKVKVLHLEVDLHDPKTGKQIVKNAKVGTGHIICTEYADINRDKALASGISDFPVFGAINGTTINGAIDTHTSRASNSGVTTKNAVKTYTAHFTADTPSFPFDWLLP